MSKYADGRVVGTGGAINVICGFVPSYVRVSAIQDNDEVFESFLFPVLAFDDGDPIIPGMVLQGGTSGARGTVKEVHIAGGEWGNGAAGYIAFEPGSVSGIWADNDVLLGEKYQGHDPSGNYGDAVGAIQNTSLRNNAAASNSTQEITGLNSASGKGFQLGSGISDDNKLLFWQAWLSEPE